MTSSKVLSSRTVEDARTLLRVLDEMTDITVPEDITVFGSDGEPLRVRLIEDTLTDGSKVYNLNIE
jgi:hypothetical protein